MSSTTCSPNLIAEAATQPELQGSRLCVRCHRAAQTQLFRPFCCARCQLVDLGGWLAESYRVEGEPAIPDLASADLPELN